MTLGDVLVSFPIGWADSSDTLVYVQNDSTGGVLRLARVEVVTHSNQTQSVILHAKEYSDQ